MYIQCNIVACSHNHYCHGNATCILYTVDSHFTVNNIEYCMLPWTCNSKFPFYHWVKYIAAINIKVLSLHVKCTTLLYDFKNISIFKRDFNNNLQNGILQKFLQYELIWYMWIDGWMDKRKLTGDCCDMQRHLNRTTNILQFQTN